MADRDSNEAIVLLLFINIALGAWVWHVVSSSNDRFNTYTKEVKMLVNSYRKDMDGADGALGRRLNILECQHEEGCEVE